MDAMNPEELLSHADFVRHLARSLVFDENRAADIAQDTWVAALEHPPRRGGGLRAWLALVTKNFSRKQYRSETRRRARERIAAAATDGPAPSTAEIAAREEIRGRVVEAVQALSEPRRSAILLCYYENLTHREAAKRLGVPLETLRTRLKRGLALLRARLDAEYNGDRQVWRLALAPLAGIDLADPSPVALSSASAGLATASGFKALASAAAVLILGTFVVVWALFPSEQDRPEETFSAASPKEAGRGGEGVETVARPAEAMEGSSVVAMEHEALTPSSTAVVWKGTLIDYDGLPKGGVAILPRMVRARLPDVEPEKDLLKESAENGAFEIRGLVPGEYVVHLSFSSSMGRRSWVEWGPMVFEEPGTIEKDILVAESPGAIVAGVVVDEVTGLPLTRPPREPGDLIDYVVSLHNPDLDQEMFTVQVDCETGAFCLRDLPSAVYNLYLLGPGLNRKILPGLVDVREQKIVDDLRLTVPPLGELRILLSGFTEEERRAVEARFEFKKSQPGGPLSIFRTEEVTLAAPEGKGLVRFSHEDLGAVARSFEIKRGEVFEIAVLKSDFSIEEPEAGQVTVRLRKKDGTPLADATVCFCKNMGPIPFMSRSPNVGVTDSNGLFKIEKIEPGLWSAWCSLFSAEKFALLMKNRNLLDLSGVLDTAVFCGIEIPQSPGPGFTVDLVYPAGKIRGMLCDKTTGLLLEDEGMLLRWIMVNDPDQDFNVCGMALANSGSRFELTGIGPGKYQFGAAVFGYAHYLSEVFSLDEGEVLDLGKVMLTPTGTMEIEVRDPDGGPVRFHADWEGKSRVMSVYGLDAVPIAPDTVVFGNLPFGPLAVEVTAFGFEPVTISLDIEPNNRARASVVLKRAE